MIGNHVTTGDKSKKEIQARYRKVRPLLLAQLQGDDRRRFENAWLGRLFVSDDDLAKWDAIVQASAEREA